jgi:hypothetical protein
MVWQSPLQGLVMLGVVNFVLGVTVAVSLGLYASVAYLDHIGAGHKPVRASAVAVAAQKPARKPANVDPLAEQDDTVREPAKDAKHNGKKRAPRRRDEARRQNW